MPEVAASVIIPVCHDWERTRGCLKSIAAHTDLEGLEVIAIDIASTDITGQALPCQGKLLFGDAFRHIRLDSKVGLAAARNMGARMAAGEFIVFLDNDITVRHGWLAPLMADFSAFANIAASAPVLLCAEKGPFGHTVDHLGLVIDPFFAVRHLHGGIPADSPLAHKRRFFQAVAAACMVMRKSFFLDAGGFDEALAEYADVDLGARFCAKGLRMTVNPQAMVLRELDHAEACRRREALASGQMQGNSLGLLHPDWHRHLEDDGLWLQVSKWQTLRPALPEKRSVELQRAVAADGNIVDVVAANPYWQKGWAGLLKGWGDEESGLALARMYLEFFHDPPDIGQLLDLKWAVRDADMFSACIARLKTFFYSADASGEGARARLQWCLSRRLGGLAEQYAALIRNLDNFEKQDVRALAQEVWQFENGSGIPHSPVDDQAYALWRMAVDLPQREQIIMPFMRTCEQERGDLPKFSILMPVYNPDPEHLAAALDSVLAQIYPHWELCIADDASTDPGAGAILASYAAKDARVRVCRRERNGHIAAATNTALEMAANPWCALLDQDDLLTSDALAFVARAILANPQGTLFFSDEDKLVGRDGFCNPYFKNDKWDWELIAVQNYVSHLGVYQTARLREIGGFREGFPGAQDHDLVLRYAAHGPSGDFIHISHVLYHWRVHAASSALSVAVKGYAIESGRLAAQAWLDEYAPDARLENIAKCLWPRIKYPLPGRIPAVSVICPVPGAEFPVGAYYAAWARASAVQIVFVCEQGAYAEIAEKLRVAGHGMDRCSLIAVPDGSPAVHCLRLGAQQADGEILGFAGWNIVPGCDNWLEEIASCLMRPHIGAVGGKMLGKDGSLLHGGYLADAGGSLKRLFAGCPVDASIWFGWTTLARTVDALDGLCLFTKADLFARAGGLDEAMLDWACQDYCLRLASLGMRVVWWPFAEFRQLDEGDAVRIKGVELFSIKWHNRVKPVNGNLLVLGPGWQLYDPSDKSFDFVADEYIRLYPHIGKNGYDPLLHFIKGGKQEGLKGHFSHIDYSGLTPARIEQWRKKQKTGVVVCTSLCGDYERLLPPAFLNDGWEYVCYSDCQRESWGIWDIRQIPYENDDLTRKSRWAKLNLPLLFPDAAWVFWHDSNIVITGNLETLLRGPEDDNGLYMVRHHIRDCVYDEATACLTAQKDSRGSLGRQLDAYHKGGMPRHLGMTENNFFLLNPGNAKVKKIFADWWMEYCKFSRRDQISLPYVFYKNNYRPGLLLPARMNARSCPDLCYMTHEETRWVTAPKWYNK